MIALYIVFGLSAFVVFYAMIGYPLTIKIIEATKKPSELPKNYDYLPKVSYMIVAHNEEAVIKEKLENTISIDYPSDRFEIIVASDNSTDRTNEFTLNFIKEHPEYDIHLYCAKQRKGKTNAQNEAQKTATGEILVMTDANSMVRENAVRELVSSFTEDDIVYVCGRQVYSNASDNSVSNSESTYGDYDLFMKSVESRIQTITAGEGSLYACRNSEYIDFDPIMCHDSAMPFAYALLGKRAIFNENAIASEKAGEEIGDEFGRKVRMNRYILSTLKNSVKTLNIFKYKWFSFFYFGHRTCRYSLWIAHILLLLSTFLLMCFGSIFGTIMFIGQVIAILIAIAALKFDLSFSLFRLLGYYLMTVFAQIVGVRNILTGKAKPFWEAAGTTRN